MKCRFLNLNKPPQHESQKGWPQAAACKPSEGKSSKQIPHVIYQTIRQVRKQETEVK